MQPVEWLYLLSYLFVPGFHTPDLNVGQMYSDVAAVTRSGNLADFILCNITLGQKASFLWPVNAGRLTQTAGLFLLGFLLARRQLFVQSDNSLAFWKRLLLIAAIAFIPLYALHSHLSSSPEGAGAIFSTISEMWRNLAFTFVLIAGFVILFYRTSFSRHSGTLQLYGKNESHQLHNTINFRSTHIFSFRTVSGAPLRLYRKPCDRPAGIRHSDYLQPLVARASPPRPAGITLA